MRATQRDFQTLSRRVAATCRVWFFCGPDESGAELAAARVTAELSDTGERIELSGADLKADPVRLVDEARSASLFGGARHIVARVSGEEAHDAVRSFLEMADLGEMEGACPVLIVATSATDKSRTAKLLVDRSDGLVAMFHQPEINDVRREIRAMLDGHGVKCAGEVVDRLTHAGNMDLRIARSEVDKLALYLDATPKTPQTATMEALDEISASTAEDDLPPIVNAVLSGDLKRLPGELRRIDELGLNAVGIVLALERRAAQLAGLAARMAPHEDIQRFLERQNVFFRERRVIEEQLKRWPAHKLDRLVTRLTDLHRALIGNSQTADLLMSQALVQITRFARASRRN